MESQKSNQTSWNYTAMLLRITIPIVLSWLKKKARKKIDDLACLATCRCITPAMVSSNANSLLADENTQEWLLGLIKAYYYI